jgi:Fic family protein
MKSFVDLERTLAGQPPRLGAALARVDEGRGKEALFKYQVPELLQRLANDARIESVTASSAIEGVVVEDAARRARVVEAEGPIQLRNRSEKEVRGYRDALDYLIRRGGEEKPNLPLILHMHRLFYGHTGSQAGGLLKTADNQIIPNEPETGRRVVFEPPYQQTEFLLRELVDRYNTAVDQHSGHPVAILGAFAVDFLAIHPFGDGNGRVSRLLTNHLLLRAGYGVVRYVSLEQRVLEQRSRYYDSLQDSQNRWHEAEHSVWPFVAFLTDMLVESYERFEQRLAASRRSTSGTKLARVRAYVLDEAPARVTLAQIRRQLPGVSDMTIGNALRQLQAEGLIDLDGLGRSAGYRRRQPESSKSIL